MNPEQSRFCNVTSFPSPWIPERAQGDQFARSSSSIAISIGPRRPTESRDLPVHASLHIRGREQRGFLVAERTLCAPLPRILFSSGMFFASRNNRVPRFPPRLCAPPLPPMIYAPLSAVILIIIPGLFVYRSTRVEHRKRLFMPRTIARVW